MLLKGVVTESLASSFTDLYIVFLLPFFFPLFFFSFVIFVCFLFSICDGNLFQSCSYVV